MTPRARLIFLGLSFTVLILVARWVSGDFSFLLRQFWFTSGFLLLLLLSLVDQPHFSKDANIFVNGVTAWVSLLLVDGPARDFLWWIFFAWSLYLIVSSYCLMWLRSQALGKEHGLVQLLSRLNREIGRPEAIFSAFLLWGAIGHFGADSSGLAALFAFWAVFMILNLPALARTMERWLGGNDERGPTTVGHVTSIVSPRVAEAVFPATLSGLGTGSRTRLLTPSGQEVSKAVVVDDRHIGGLRVARLGLTNVAASWASISELPQGSIRVEIVEPAPEDNDDRPVGVVDTGSDVSKIVFHSHPDTGLEVGSVVWVDLPQGARAYFQAVSAQLVQTAAPEGNLLQTARVAAAQLGTWDSEHSRFAPVGWVAPAGGLVHRAGKNHPAEHLVPDECAVIGCIPHSEFPVHLNLEDVVTHNTALIGVTGSGKSYFAFHLIAALVEHGVKVLVLDLSREHDLYLAKYSPTALKTPAEVASWIASDSPVGIHQFAIAAQGFPKATADFVEAAFSELAKAKLARGKNLPARLCVVFEEAHSLIPEWNQVAQKGDEQQVNRTARTILQGRKYGMGAVVISQRTANVTKTILNQCNTILALQSFDQTGLDFLSNYMGADYAQAISTLRARHGILVGKASSSLRPVVITITDLADEWGPAGSTTPDGTPEDD